MIELLSWNLVSFAGMAVLCLGTFNIAFANMTSEKTLFESSTVLAQRMLETPQGQGASFSLSFISGDARFLANKEKMTTVVAEASQGTSVAPVSPSASLPSLATMPLEDIAVFLRQRYLGMVPTKWAERMPGVTSRLHTPRKGVRPVVALTFDACDGGKDKYDVKLIDFLRQRNIPATLFISSRWLRKHPQGMDSLARNPLFEIAGHGLRHRPCSVMGLEVYGITGTASVGALVQEVEENARDIARSAGHRPRWFRSGTAYYDNVAVAMIRDMGFGIAGYTVAADQGATLSAAQVCEQLLRAQDGDILLLHMNHPESGTAEGVKLALPVLLERGYRFVRMSDSLPDE